MVSEKLIDCNKFLTYVLASFFYFLIKAKDSVIKNYIKNYLKPITHLHRVILMKLRISKKVKKKVTIPGIEHKLYAAQGRVLNHYVMIVINSRSLFSTFFLLPSCGRIIK